MATHVKRGKYFCLLQKKNFHQCNHCTQVFTSHRDLMQHTINEHQYCKLICPWRVSSERLFRYLADLSIHVQRQHPSLHQNMPPRAMTAEHCFYYSQVPAQCLTRFIAVPLFTSPEAQFAWIVSPGGVPVAPLVHPTG